MSNDQQVIVGLGSTGLSCANYLASRGENFKVVDSRSNPPGLEEFQQHFSGVDLELGDFNRETFLQASRLIVSPGVSLKTPEIVGAIAHGVPITGDIEIFSQQVKAPIIAVTGSNGKSTVVAILAEILREAKVDFALGGNLEGDNFKPALDLLREPEKEMYVLELSSFQLETTSHLSAAVAVMLNLSEDHMDRYEDLEEYYQAKARIYNGCKRVVINREDEHSRLAEGLGVPSWDYGFGCPTAGSLGLLETDGDEYLAYQYEKIVSVSELKVIGRHNSLNMLAAIGLALAVDVDMDFIREGARKFSGLPHRCQWIRRLNGVNFYNDSKGTNVGATIAAIESLGQHISGHVLLIAGGVGKDANFSDLLPVLNRWGKEVILIGQDAVEIAASFDAEINTHFANNLSDAVSVAQAHAKSGDAVLLSPACASFDMFDNFQHRGSVFVDAVESLH